MIESITILAVSHTGAAGETGNVITHLAGEFGIEWKLLIAQIINFGVVASLLYYLAFKPILKTLEARRQRIAEGLQYSEEMEEKLKDTEKQYLATMKEAAGKAKGVVDTARSQAKTYTEQQTQEAAKRAESMMKKAGVAIELEKQQMIKDARGELAGLVVATTAKVLEKDLSPEDRSAFSESAAKELGIT